MAREADVIIIGAGLSGLIAARDVLAAGYEPLILEADQRVGGRILTQDVEGVPLELGAQWIGDTHHRMEALAAELGVDIYPQFEDGETSYEFAGEVLRERAFYARYAGELSGVERVLRTLDQMAETVPVDAPWLAPEADAWDRVTVGQWYGSQGLSRVARTLLEICTVGILAFRRLERAAHLRGGAGPDVQRQLPARRGRRTWHHPGLPGGRIGAGSRAVAGRTAAQCPARGTRASLRPARRGAAAHRRTRLGRPRMDPGLLQLEHGTVRADPLRRGTVRADRPGQVGRDRDR